ncbi:AMP-binding protein [Fangia hongkongensis]|uniref:AMP-binding protein n=1 Tax=Fangia hongkongensis TaxID=270495 RepID=UPI00036A8052|nr:AMP-binding protein [Fangia hongkongensis]MBK2125852.1 AMP-binding protein [Fangia hongkongensis]
MVVVLIVILVLIALALGSLFLWPNKTLRYLMQVKSRQRYMCNFHHVNYVPENTSAIVISNKVNLFLATLLRQIAKQKVTVILEYKNPPDKLTSFLLKRAGIDILAQRFMGSWSKEGILLCDQNDYAEAAKLHHHIIPLQVCGFECIKYNKGKNVPQWLHLGFFDPISQNMGDKELKDHLAAKNIYAWERYISLMPAIPEVWIKQAKARKGKKVIADSTGVELSSERMLVGTLALSQTIEPLLREQERVGICLPPSVGGSMAMMCAFILGKTIVNLNYTASQKALDAAINESNIKTIITSGRFIEQLKKKGFFLEEVFSQSNIILLEDIKQQIDKFTLIKFLLTVKLSSAESLIRKYVKHVSTEHTAAILFSSGSEGKPKGVMLSHKNILGNIKQSMIILGAKSDDSILSILPIFHAFGMTATTLLPLLEGVFMICHPDPTDAQVLGELAEKYKPTILCGTSTFFRMYSRSRQLASEQFSSLNFVVAGAEKLLPEVRAMFEKKFNKVIYEGYGTTELSPVASVNQPDEDGRINNKIGTVGSSVLGGRFMIIDPDTKEELPVGEAGMITFGGVNVMQGYLHNIEKTDEVIFKRNRIRWYQTGDKGSLDEEGYLTILDRYSRFAKLGGEMVSLSAVESEIIQLLGVDDEEAEVLAVSTPDIKKGEKISLLYTMDRDAEELRSLVKSSGMNNLLKPQAFFKVESIPKLGSGKTDFAAAKTLTLELLKQADA